MKRIPFSSETEIRHALSGVARHLEAGGLIAYPTETVYGFGCALHADALAALRRLKRRAGHKPFLLLVAGASAVRGVQWTATARRLAERFWPGPLTLALAAEPGAYPGEVVSAEGTVALRASPHPAPRALVAALAAPITSTSANAPGAPAALTPRDVEAAGGDLEGGARVWLLDGGVLPPSAPSTLVDCSRERPRLVRAGAVPENELRIAIGDLDVA